MSARWALTSAPIRTAVIGFGTAGRAFHAPFISTNDQFDLTSIVTSDPARQRDAASLHPDAQIVSSTEDLWRHSDRLDLVIVAAPPSAHLHLATEALDHGLAVVVDKPLCISAADGAELIARAEQLNLALTVFQNRRWDGDFLTVRRLIAQGALGEVHRFESRFETWKPREAKQWKAQATSADGGGVLYDLGPHLIDQALQLFGPVAHVHAELATHRGGAAAEDDAFVSLHHQTGIRSQLWMNALAAQTGPRFRVLGSTSGYTSWGLDGQEAALRQGALPTDDGFGVAPPSTWGAIGLDGSLDRVPTERGDYAAFYRGLAGSLLTGAPLPVDPAHSLEVVQIIEDIHQHDS